MNCGGLAPATTETTAGTLRLPSRSAATTVSRYSLSCCRGRPVVRTWPFFLSTSKRPSPPADKKDIFADWSNFIEGLGLHKCLHHCLKISDFLVNIWKSDRSKIPKYQQYTDNYTTLKEQKVNPKAGSKYPFKRSRQPNMLARQMILKK